MKGGQIAAIALVPLLFLVVLFPILFGGSSSSAAACTPGGSVTASDPGAGVGQWSAQQVANATELVKIGAEMNVPARGQTLIVAAAMDESGLIPKGQVGITNAQGRAYGILQQTPYESGGTWGTIAQVMDIDYAARGFYTHLLQVPNWQTLAPTVAIHAVQRNADPNVYAQWWQPAVDLVTAITGGSPSTSTASPSPSAAAGAGSSSELAATDACGAAAQYIDADSQQLAQQIVAETNTGAIKWLSPSNFPEIQYAAAGEVVPKCTVDPRILQVIQIAYSTFGQLGISDINRLCLDEHPPGSFDGDAHTANGGGHAVDFYSLGGTATNGADANAVTLIQMLDPVMPAGHSGVGQQECRAQHGTTVQTVNMTQFADACNHIHVQVDPNNDAPLTDGSGQ